jgi:hypothetical protein
MSPRILPRSTALTIFLGAGLLLVGCTGGAAPSPSPSPSEAVSESATPSETPSPTPTPVAGNLTPLDIQKIEDAISLEQHDSLNHYLGNPIEVVNVANASDQNRSPSSTVKDLDYLNGTTGWTWSLDADTLDSYRAGTYGKWFPVDAIVGESSEGYVISITITKLVITAVLMSSSGDMLVSP